MFRPSSGSLQDTAPAAYNSFISQECDTDIKYAVMTTTNNMVSSTIPNFIRKRFIDKSPPIGRGYFNRKKLPGVLSKGLRNMIKYCFEPHLLTAEHVRELSYFNRNSLSTLYPEQQKLTVNNDRMGGIDFTYVSGLAVVLDSEMRLVAAYFALPSSGMGYRKVFYRRWKGMGFEETIWKLL